LRRLVLGVKQLLGISPVPGVQTFLFAAEVILDVKDAVAAEHSIPFPHNLHRGCEDAAPRELSVSE